MSDLESKFQKEFTDALEEKFPGCLIIKGNSSYRQGLPDWLMLHQDNWAAFEIKRNKNAKRSDSQSYYVNKMNDMSYASFVDPENYREVISEVQQTLGA